MTFRVRFSISDSSQLLDKLGESHTKTNCKLTERDAEDTEAFPYQLKLHQASSRLKLSNDFRYIKQIITCDEMWIYRVGK